MSLYQVVQDAHQVIQDTVNTDWISVTQINDSSLHNSVDQVQSSYVDPCFIVSITNQLYYSYALDGGKSVDDNILNNRAALTISTSNTLYEFLTKDVSIYGTVDKPLFVASDIALYFGDTNPSYNLQTIDQRYIKTYGKSQKLLSEIGLYTYLFSLKTRKAIEFMNRISDTIHSQLIDRNKVATKIATDLYKYVINNIINTHSRCDVIFMCDDTSKPTSNMYEFVISDAVTTILGNKRDEMLYDQYEIFVYHLLHDVKWTSANLFIAVLKLYAVQLLLLYKSGIQLQKQVDYSYLLSTEYIIKLNDTQLTES